MLFVLLALCLVFFVCNVTSRPNLFPPSLVLRQASPASGACNASCAEYQQLFHDCNHPHCGCNVQWMQAQGNCLLCQASTPQDEAAVQFLLNTEMVECRSDGLPVNFQLSLPPTAEAIVRRFNRGSAVLRREQRAFLALQITGGHVGLAIVLAAAIFTRKVRRDPTFLNFCITWIFSSIVYSLLLYHGTDGHDLANTLGIVLPERCLTQAVLVNGAQVMTACSTLALVMQLWIGLRSAIHGLTPDGILQSKWLTYASLLAPYLAFIAFAIPTVFVGRAYVDVGGVTFQRSIPGNFYCTLVKINPFLLAIFGTTMGLLLIAVGFDVHIILILYRHWKSFRQVQAGGPVSLSILLRVLLFSLYRMVVAIAYGTVVNRPPTVSSTGQSQTLEVLFALPVWVDLLQAALPLMAFFVLGINRDVFNTFMFWRNHFNFRAFKTTKTTATRSETTSMLKRPTSYEGNAFYEKTISRDKELIPSSA